MNFSSSLYIEFLLRADKILFIPFNLLKILFDHLNLFIP